MPELFVNNQTTVVNHTQNVNQKETVVVGFFPKSAVLGTMHFKLSTKWSEMLQYCCATLAQQSLDQLVMGDGYPSDVLIMDLIRRFLCNIYNIS